LLFLRGAALLGLLTLFQSPPEKTLLDGSVQPCADTKESTSGVPAVHVYAFDAAKAKTVRASLDVIDTLDWENGGTALRKASAEYDRLMQRVQRSRSLGYATSNGNGDFEIMVPQVDSVLVFAEAKPGTSEPFFFASRTYAVRGEEEVRVILLMCNESH
jgi:hypothetical protein